jgi:hypothetical protein
MLEHPNHAGRHVWVAGPDRRYPRAA